jgi:hypothetical protein
MGVGWGGPRFPARKKKSKIFWALKSMSRRGLASRLI